MRWNSPVPAHIWRLYECGYVTRASWLKPSDHVSGNWEHDEHADDGGMIFFDPKQADKESERWNKLCCAVWEKRGYFSHRLWCTYILTCTLTDEGCIWVTEWCGGCSYMITVCIIESFACFMTVFALECVHYQSTFVLAKDLSGHVACRCFFNPRGLLVWKTLPKLPQPELANRTRRQKGSPEGKSKFLKISM